MGAMAMDAHGHADFWTGCDSVHSAYMRLDSTFQHIEDWMVIQRQNDGEGVIRTDSAGYCMVVWDGYPGVYWAVRRAEGTWIHPLAVVDPSVAAQSLSIVTMDSTRYAFTAMSAIPGNFDQLCLYTWGFPSNDATPEPKRSNSTAITLSAYPDPFNLATVISFSVLRSARAKLTVYDVTGREVKVLINKVVNGGDHLVTFDGSALASGVYFAKLEAQSMTRVQKIVLMK